MSRYIRQPGQSNFNDINDAQASEWNTIIECKNWTEEYSLPPRICIDTQNYTSYKFVYNSYCKPFSGGTTYFKTNDSSANYRSHHGPRCLSNNLELQFDTTGGGIVQWGAAAACADYACFLGYNSFELIITPGNNNSIGYWANNFSPQSCCPGSSLAVGTSNQSWGSIDWVEFCVSNTTFKPKSQYSSWYVYGKQR